MKEKFVIMMGAVLFIVLCGCVFFYMENYDKLYYTRIDNMKIEKLSAKEYEYELVSYDVNGKKKKLKFKTSKELRNTAFLELEVRILGVHSWKEVEYEELPKKVQEKY
jgi:uncharacterized protein (TIGR01655 family)